MSAGSTRASPRPTSLPVDSLTFKVISCVAVDESDMMFGLPKGMGADTRPAEPGGGHDTARLGDAINL